MKKIAFLLSLLASGSALADSYDTVCIVLAPAAGECASTSNPYQIMTVMIRTVPRTNSAGEYSQCYGDVRTPETSTLCYASEAAAWKDVSGLRKAGLCR